MTSRTLPSVPPAPFSNAEYEALKSFTDSQYVTIVAALPTGLGQIIKRLLENNVALAAELNTTRTVLTGVENLCDNATGRGIGNSAVNARSLRALLCACTPLPTTRHSQGPPIMVRNPGCPLHNPQIATQPVDGAAA
ncbi:hypothetical protein [Tessaracoccus sp.]